ncbi:MAG: hypothetical protein JOY80_02880 [Candidatus Dormibacteraeota bacterium]|nr:hypothetical protein [Candidatus Dormibacteraeota bacterium]
MLLTSATTVAVLVPGRLVAVAASHNGPHVMVIVEENREADSVVGSSAAPYITMLANRYGYATNAFGQSHPSLPNYLELISGSTQGVLDDGTGYSFTGPTLVDQLSQYGVTWRDYMEDMPAACYSGAASGGYAKKHDPFMYFTSITGNASQCANVVPDAVFDSDLHSATPPDFMWVTPNLCHDGHDCSTATTDAWLASMLSPVLDSAWFADDGNVIITWDEGSSDASCCDGAAGGHIATIVVASQQSQHITMQASVDHAGTLRTIEQLYGLDLLGDAACSCSGSLLPLIPTAASPTGLTWLTAPHLR